MSEQSRNRLVGMKAQSLCFFPYRNIYRALLLRIEHCKTEKSIQRLPIYIFLFFFCFLFSVRSKDHVPCVIGLRIIRIIELTRRILVGVSTWTSTDTCSTTLMSRPIKVVQIGVNPVAHILCEITRRATVLIFGTFEDWRRGWSR